MDTQPLQLRAGERLLLENKIDLLDGRMAAFMANMNDRSNQFYANRMLPLESKVDAQKARVYFALGLAVMTALVSLVTLVLVVILHAIG